MAELFQKDVRTINEHIQNVFAEGELSPRSVIRKFRITAADGKGYETGHYNLDWWVSDREWASVQGAVVRALEARMAEFDQDWGGLEGKI